MKSRSVETNQIALPGLETFLCECGCNQYSMRSTRGNPRRYINDTHKKRAARQRESIARTDGRVKMTPKGYLYLTTTNKSELEALWEELAPQQQAVIRMMCETGFDACDIQAALTGLFGLHPCK